MEVLRRALDAHTDDDGICRFSLVRGETGTTDC